jgi:excisionase family DNA binding protein
MCIAASEGATGPRRLPRLLSVRAVSEATTLPASTIYDLVARGELPVVRVTGRAIRIAEDDILRWIEVRREVDL